MFVVEIVKGGLNNIDFELVLVDFLVKWIVLEVLYEY